jgi:hypothetical protein
MGRLGLCPVAWASSKRDVFPLQFRYRLVPWIYDSGGPLVDPHHANAYSPDTAL